MRTEPHRSITKARVDYRYGDAEARAKLKEQFRDLDLAVLVIPLTQCLRRVLPHCDEVTAAYYEHNLASLHDGTEAWAITWTEGDQRRVETSVAICPEDDQAMRDNVRFQCAQELLEQFQALLIRALRIQASQPVEAEFAPAPAAG